jgi:hypothetical protein
MRHERLNFHPLDNRATTNIAADDLVRFLRATGHEPRIVALSQREPSGEAGVAQTLSPAPSSPHRRERASEGHGHGR